MKTISKINVFEACEKGDLESLQKYIAEGGDMHDSTPSGTAPVMFAARAGQNDVLLWLEKNGFDPAQEWDLNESESILHYAVDQPRTVRLLLDLGADPNADGNWGTPLHYTDNPETAEMLIAAGADINKVSRGLSPLHMAAEHDRVDVIRVLESHGVDYTYDYRGFTPLVIAEFYGAQNAAKVLRELGAKE